MATSPGHPASSGWVERLERLIARSPADSTEISWLEVEHGEAGTGPRRGDGGGRRRSVAIRVRESGRTGLHRTGVDEPSELENAVRDALAVARLAPPSPAFPLAAKREAEPPLAEEDLFDPAVAALGPAAARAWLERLAGPEISCHLAWTTARLAFVHSQGLTRATAVTAATLSIRAGQGETAGQARQAARSLAALAPEELLARARQRQAGETAAAPADGPLVLAPEGAAVLLELLNRQALSSAAMLTRRSPLAGRLGEAIFPSLLTLRDDATDPRALPLPFDLCGQVKHPVALIDRGTFATSAVDFSLAQETGLPPTPHAVSFDESIAGHLHLEPGMLSEGGEPAGLGDLSELMGLAALKNGLWASSLSSPEPFRDARGLGFRAILGGVRRLEDGKPGAALPDQLWEDHLVDVLTRLLFVGGTACTVGLGACGLGGITAPLLALAPGGARRAVVRPVQPP